MTLMLTVSNLAHCIALLLSRYAVVLDTRNSSGDEIANVNFFTTTSYTALQNIIARAYIPPKINAVMYCNTGLPNSVK